MLSDFGSSQQVYLAAGSTDMRRSIDGLAVLVQESFKLDPFSPCLFVFCNRRRDRVKILEWDNAGFWIHYRRLEQGRFQWPNSPESGPIAITRRELRWLLDGLPITQPKAHSKVGVQRVI